MSAQKAVLATPMTGTQTAHAHARAGLAGETFCALQGQ
jgi:hypothetical protein